MSTARSPRHAHHEGVATLVRSVPVRLVEVSRDGCRLECARRIESGTSGQLAVELAGLMRIDDGRVARCQQRMGAGQVFQLGTELLRTRRLGRRTVRMAVRRLIGSATGVLQVHAESVVSFPLRSRHHEEEGKSDGRAPPSASDRGS